VYVTGRVTQNPEPVSLSTSTMVFTLVVHLFTQPGKEAQMKSELVKASQAYSKDKGTLAWFVMQDAKEPTKWVIVERYETQSVKSSSSLRLSIG
jgi:quinol monooxygenase YgiN